MKVLSVVMAVVITAFVGIGSSFAGSEGSGKERVTWVQQSALSLRRAS